MIKLSDSIMTGTYFWYHRKGRLQHNLGACPEATLAAKNGGHIVSDCAAGEDSGVTDGG